MATAAAAREFAVGAEELLQRAEAAGRPLGYSVRRIDAATVQLKEPASAAMFVVSLVAPASWFLWVFGFGHTITVTVRGAEAHCVATNWGFGPIASRRARKALEQLLCALDPGQAVYLLSLPPAPTVASPPVTPDSPAVERRFCSRCGRCVEPTDAFCSSCGGRV